MYRTTYLRLLSGRISTTFSAFASSDTSVNLPNPCIAMAPDTNHIVCYHPEKEHPYEYTKSIDRNDPSFAQVSKWNIYRYLSKIIFPKLRHKQYP
jgi:hypothetical protein